MGGIYKVTRGDTEDPQHDALVVIYGWGPLHAFFELIAVEEGIQLKTMKDFGGSAPWDQVHSELRPLFDRSLLDGDHLSADLCNVMLPRLIEISGKWRSGAFPKIVLEEWMREAQLSNLDSLIAILRAGVTTSRGITIE